MSAESHLNSRCSDDEKLSLTPLWIMFTAGSILCIVYALLAFNILQGDGAWEKRGQFGAMFGSLSALFSAFALGGVIFAIFIQRKEFLKSREDFHRLLTAQKDSTQLDVLKHAYDYIRETHVDRVAVYEEEASIRGVKTIDDLKIFEATDAATAVHNVANCYHYIGLLAHSGLLTRQTELLQEGAQTIVRIHTIIWPIIELQRERTGQSEYKQYFAWLAERAKDYSAGPRP